MIKISEEEYKKLNYREQEAYLIRCPRCQIKREPYPIAECCEGDCYMCDTTTPPDKRIIKGDRIFCSDECLTDFMLEKD